jgi:sec-independent protein translocase protein TatA
MELIVVLVIALIVLGPKKLPQAGRSVGSAIRELKHSLSGTTVERDEPIAAHELDAPHGPTPQHVAAHERQAA